MHVRRFVARDFSGHKTESAFNDLGFDLAALGSRIINKLVDNDGAVGPNRENGFINQKKLQLAFVIRGDFITNKNSAAAFDKLTHLPLTAHFNGAFDCRDNTNS